jgi:glycine cleavage system H lipoate-binding protein
LATFLETTVDKFTFRVDPTCFFNSEGVWVRFEGKLARLGLSDFLQQRSRDVAFVGSRRNRREIIEFSQIW